MHDAIINFARYQTLAARTIHPKLRLKEVEQHALHGLVGEIGEIHSLYQKVYQGHTLDKAHLRREVGDLLWFVAELCTANAWSLGEVANENLEKLLARYPREEGFTEERSLHRKEGDL